MRRIAGLLLGLFLVFCAVVATSRPAYGYVDPGSGLLALQGIASVVGTAAFYFRKRLRALFPGKQIEADPKFPAKPQGEPQKLA